MKVVRVHYVVAVVLTVVALSLVLFLYETLKGIYSDHTVEHRSPVLNRLSEQYHGVQEAGDHADNSRMTDGVNFTHNADERRSDNSSIDDKPSLLDLRPPNYCVHAFYYMWYANVTIDGEYRHWNHPYLPHWDINVDKRYPHRQHEPPDDIGASFYPQLGCYSSGDHTLIETHMKQLRNAGVGVVAVSWFPPDQSDDQGKSPDVFIPRLLSIAFKYSIRVAIHSEPYQTRSPLNFRNDLKYIIEHYGNHPALLKIPSPRNTIPLPLIYIYDSYHYPAHQWAEVFSDKGMYTVRDTPFDCVAIALLVENNHKQFMIEGKFDGFYTYFASDGFSYGSRTRVWSSLSAFANQNNLLFIPSAGPGYDDVQVRAWNSRNSKPRNGGTYYKNMMASALKNNNGILSITSFNEWHEGTQIEPAVPKHTSSYKYYDYLPHSPEHYLELTAQFSSLHECTITY